jgi:hypothetical protein
VNEDSGGDRRHQGGLRGAAVVAALAATALLAACSGGSSHSSGSGISPAQQTAKTMDVSAQCMRSHGQPNFYYANPQSISSTTVAFSVGQGYLVTGVGPHSPQFSSALGSCKHLLPPAPKRTVTKQQLDNDLKFVACMRAHGFPGYPDPDVQNGQIVQTPLPTSIDTSSPQFQTAESACGEG